jgi:hypothetical protein
VSIYSIPTESLNIAALRCAALLVPSSRRSEWLQEWIAELWYVREACVPEQGSSWQGERDVAAFCLGAFQDALCLCRTAPRHKSSKTHPLHSPAQCAFFMIILVATSWCFALMLPGVRRAIQSPLYRDSHNLILISSAGLSDDDFPSIRADQYRSWRDRRQHLFSDFAFYQTSIKLLHIAPHKEAELKIARSSSNLFDLVGLPIQFAAPSQQGSETLPTMVLSEKLWRTTFNADPHIFGRIFKVGLRSVKIVGILADGSWQLPGKPDAWLLEPDDHAASIPTTTRGYVVARRDPSLLQTPVAGTWRLFSPEENGMLSFDCVSFNDHRQAPFGIFEFVLFLAVVSLPATTSLPLGDYPASRHNFQWSVKLHRWIFLCSKLALILPIVYFGSLDLAYCSASISPETSQCLQGVISFCALLFAFRWALRDQRKRCPVCLRLLTNPARVGQPSRNFLGWNGIEFICNDGHGFLHVPEITTSWFSSQRWLYLDPSWDVLFSKPTLASSQM